MADSVPPISARLIAMKTDWEVRGVTRDQFHLTASLCRVAAPTECVRLAMTDPKVDCSGEVFGPVCVVATPSPLDPALSSALREALAPVEQSVIWAQADVRRAPPDASAAPSSATDNRLAVTPKLAALLGALPLAIGLGLGTALRRSSAAWLRSTVVAIGVWVALGALGALVASRAGVALPGGAAFAVCAAVGLAAGRAGYSGVRDGARALFAPPQQSPSAGSAPDASAQAAPEATSGSAPDASAQAAPEATSGSAPDASAQAAPEATSGSAPDATAQAAPEATSGSAPDASPQA